jgi:hypothetical protein
MSLSAVLNREDNSMAETEYPSMPALAVATSRAGSALAA